LAKLRGDGVSSLDHALSDGEDFELILAVPPDEARRMLRDQPLGVPLSAVGEFVAEAGLWQTLPDGSRQPLSPRGWVH
jgi:thiamine-monophosphate kinase